MIQVRGMSNVRRALLRVSGEGQKAASRAIVATALDIQREAKERVPVDTGRLRNSIAVAEHESGIPATVGTQIAANQIRPGMTTAVIGTSVDYAPNVEFGTSRSRAQPYLFPAAEINRPKLVERLIREFGEEFVRG